MSSYFHKQLQRCVLKRIFIPEGSWNEKTSNTKFAKCQKKDKDTFWCPCVVELALWSNLSRRAVAEGRCVHAHWTTHPNTLMVPLQHLSCPASRYMSWMAAERGRIWVPALILTAIKPPFPHKKHNSPLCYVFLNAPYMPDLQGFILSAMRVTNVTSYYLWNNS